MAKTLTQEFVKGLWTDIPPFRLVLGICPCLAVSKTLENGIGMGIAVTFVLTCSNLIISALRKVIPPKVRIACFIIIVATFVTVVDLVMQAFTYPLYLKLGIFIPLIVVNCIPLGRAEAFCYKNKVLPSIADGLGLGLGYTISLSVLGSIREILGTGAITVYETPIRVFGPQFEPFTFMVQAPGAFVSLGLLLGFMNVLAKK